MNQPLVSVIIPTYNYAHYIVDAINSVFTQDYPADKMEIVIVDDGSQDNTQAVIEALGDDRIHFHYQQNAGKSAATAKAIELARGKYLFNMDADDYYLPGKIRKTVEVFEAHPNVVHMGNPAKIIWEDSGREKVEPIPEWMMNKVIKGSELNTFFMENNMLYGGGSTYAVRASVIKPITITADINQYIDEYLIVSILPYGDTYLLSEPLTVWRVHGNNYSGKRKTKTELRKKEEQLLASSAGTLAQLKKLQKLPESILKLYEFKHQMRTISMKEKLGEKSFSDIFNFFTYFCFNNQQKRRVLQKYSAFNRLIPQSLLRLLKKVR
ncbi:MAG: glycosyltransferase family 2 protein [Bacteroidota bacterium]